MKSLQDYREEHRVKIRQVWLFFFLLDGVFTYPRILFNRPVLADVVVLRDLHLPVPLKLLTENPS